MKGYGILLPGHILCHDHHTKQPYFVKTKRTALRALEKVLAVWMADGAEVVKLELDESTSTYTVRSC